LNGANHDLALEIASLPADVRGFGTIKLASLERARERERELLEHVGPQS
jgi:indolepyruvate ferredoxin oxidoreductase